jgi:hypothetical protein
MFHFIIKPALMYAFFYHGKRRLSNTFWQMDTPLASTTKKNLFPLPSSREKRRSIILTLTFEID